MKVADLLTLDRIVAPVRSGSLGETVDALVHRLVTAGALAAEDLEEELDGEALRSPEAVRRVAGGEVLVLGVRSSAASDLLGGLGIPAEPFSDPEISKEPVRAVLLLLTPRDPTTLERPVDRLADFLDDEKARGRLLACRTGSEVRSLRRFMELELHDELRVEDALTPLTYRIYPDTPLEEVVDLMVRKNLQAVPVVGEKYELLGMITAAEALRHSVSRHRKSGEEKERRSSDEGVRTARDAMIRTVMCVSEDENLLDAANLMVNKEMGQLPVVRAGEIIGLLTRERVLKALFP